MLALTKCKVLGEVDIHDGQSINIGNPDNNVSVAQLAKLIIAAFKQYPDYREHAKAATVVVVPSGTYFGKYYQDIQRRVPSIAAIRKQLGWKPKVNLEKGLKLTVDWYLKNKAWLDHVTSGEYQTYYDKMYLGK